MVCYAAYDLCISSCSVPQGYAEGILWKSSGFLHISPAFFTTAKFMVQVVSAEQTGDNLSSCSFKFNLISIYTEVRKNTLISKKYLPLKHELLSMRLTLPVLFVKRKIRNSIVYLYYEIIY